MTTHDLFMETNNKYKLYNVVKKCLYLRYYVLKISWYITVNNCCNLVDIFTILLDYNRVKKPMHLIVLYAFIGM